MITAIVLKLFDGKGFVDASEFAKTVMAFLFLLCVGMAFNLDIGLIRLVYKLGS